jgi:hypothetical protein
MPTEDARRQGVEMRFGESRRPQTRKTARKMRSKEDLWLLAAPVVWCKHFALLRTCIWEGQRAFADGSKEEWMREGGRSFDDAPIDGRTLAPIEVVYGRANAGQDPRRSWMMANGEAARPGNAGMRGRACEKNSSLGGFAVRVKASSSLGLNGGPNPPSEGASVKNTYDVHRRASSGGMTEGKESRGGAPIDGRTLASSENIYGRANKMHYVSKERTDGKKDSQAQRGGERIGESGGAFSTARFGPLNPQGYREATIPRRSQDGPTREGTGEKCPARVEWRSRFLVPQPSIQ